MAELDEKIKEDLNIDETRLNIELQQQPGKFFYWATMKAKAAAKSRTQKTYVETLKANKAKSFKDGLAADPKIRVTERMLDDYLDMDKEIIKAKEDLINTQYAEAVLDAAEDAMRQRHYALIELVRSKEAERISLNEYESMKREFEARDTKKRT